MAEPPAAIGELVNESPSAALRFDEPQLVEFVASWLVEFRPEGHEIGIWDGTRLGHQYEEHGSFGYGQIRRRDSHVCKLIDFKNDRSPDAGVATSWPDSERK